MITIEDIKEELFLELNSSVNKAKLSTYKGKYFNEVFPNTSSNLSTLLAESLYKIKDWETNYWVDDIILTKIKYADHVNKVWGVVIFGNHSNDEQYVAPLYAEISKNEINFLFFDDSTTDLIPYEKFNINRNISDKDYYSNLKWNIEERKWRYNTSI